MAIDLESQNLTLDHNYLRKTRKMPKTVQKALAVQTKYTGYQRAKEALRIIKRTNPRQTKTYEKLLDKAYTGFIYACVNFADE